MNRESAVTLIKEITEEKCTELTGHDIVLLKNGLKENEQDYELFIKTKLKKSSINCLEMVIQDAGCSIRYGAEGITIFGTYNHTEETGIT